MRVKRVRYGDDEPPERLTRWLDRGRWRRDWPEYDSEWDAYRAWRAEVKAWATDHGGEVGEVDGVDVFVMLRAAHVAVRMPPEVAAEAARRHAQKFRREAREVAARVPGAMWILTGGDDDADGPS